MQWDLQDTAQLTIWIKLNITVWFLLVNKRLWSDLTGETCEQNICSSTEAPLWQGCQSRQAHKAKLLTQWSCLKLHKASHTKNHTLQVGLTVSVLILTKIHTLGADNPKLVCCIVKAYSSFFSYLQRVRVIFRNNLSRSRTSSADHLQVSVSGSWQVSILLAFWHTFYCWDFVGTPHADLALARSAQGCKNWRPQERHKSTQDGHKVSHLISN